MIDVLQKGKILTDGLVPGSKGNLVAAQIVEISQSAYVVKISQSGYVVKRKIVCSNSLCFHVSGSLSIQMLAQTGIHAFFSWCIDCAFP